MSTKIDVENLQAIMRHFHIATQLRMAIFDLEFHELIAWPTERNALCNLLRTTKEGDARCRICDLSAQYQVHQNICQNYIYTCHAGLFDAIAPIMDDRRIIGYMMIGQCVPKDVPIKKAWSDSLHYCEDIIDISVIKKEYYKFPRLTREQMESCVQIMNACALYIGSHKYVNPESDEIFAKIRLYINAHITETLSTALLCEKLLLPRNALFRIMKSETGLTPGQYIQAKRIELAQSLLQNRELSIAEVAGLCGITDYNYFSRIFKKQLGLSPREYRMKWIRSQ